MSSLNAKLNDILFESVMLMNSSVNRSCIILQSTQFTSHLGSPGKRQGRNGAEKWGLFGNVNKDDIYQYPDDNVQ